MLPDRSILNGQKMLENANFENFKGDILDNFQTMCFTDFFLSFLDFFLVFLLIFFEYENTVSGSLQSN